MSAPEPRLTPEQSVDVSMARVALANCKADTDPGHHTRHLGSLEYHVEVLLDVIEALTGSDAR
jgi:hypothetical protein